MSETLDPLRVPLWGSRLIEASAGTGKTWTIAALYLRLVLGHGQAGAAFARPLVPAEILVMTFTVAATRELSDRIRARLVQAARCFRGEREPSADDTFLHALVSDYEPGESRAAAAWRLSMAAEAMDDSAVHTIDAWCQRMLREHAFDSGSLFDEELLADESAFVDEAARDYWRRNIYPLTGTALDRALAIWPTVGRLVEDVRALQPYAVGNGGEDVAVGLLLDAARLQVEASRRATVQRLKTGWDECAVQMREWLETRLGATPCPFDRVKLRAGSVATWCEAIGQWATSAELVQPALTTAAWRRLSPEGLQEARKGPAPLVLPAWSAELARLREAIAKLPLTEDAMRMHAAASVKVRVSELKRGAGTPGFQDMLERLDAALGGPNGERLRARIAAQYPAALIDEFQDTSPLQYRIFDRIYRPSMNDPATALFLIGDPKQSIFAFRGADIRSYLGARRATAERHYLLGTNHRSTPALVAAVNHLFLNAEERSGEGAFMFRTAQDAADSPLPFVPVGARGRSEQFQASSGGVPVLTVCHDAEVRPRREILPLFASRCAEHIVSLLNDPQAGFADRERGFVRLRPADIAVLVRDGYEADAVRAALRRRHVASVYLSDRDSVFSSPEAADLVRWLEAVASPLDSRRVRAAFATPLIGLSLAALAVLANDDAAFEARVEQLRQLKSVWLRQGVLPMLRQTLHLLELPSRWLAEPDGERKLTNVLHLAELLQSAVAHVEGEETLIRWLAEQIADPHSGGEENVVRLESDADLVKVITIFKAKGLEYPLVYLPFACGFRAARKNKQGFLTVPADGDERRVIFEPNKEDIDAADRERQQEDLRLLYVALTRARHALWVGVAAYKGWGDEPCHFHRSALGYLLGGTARVAGHDIAALLHKVCGDVPSVALMPGGSPSQTRVEARAGPSTLGDALSYSAQFEVDWSIGSFSRLVRDLSKSPITQVPADPALQEELLVAPVESPAPPGVRPPRHRFPRGALPGNFLHDQLEWLAAARFGLARDADLCDQLRRRCERQGWGHRADDVVEWLSEVVTTSLPSVGVALDALSVVLPEMEFWFPSQGLAAGRIDALCNEHMLGGRLRPPLGKRSLNGMVMGFADLVFKHGGRYWVLDYKSNALGLEDADYHREALEISMAEHRYDVQAALYLTALDRLLRTRLGPDYLPERHLGGAIYLFLRGVHGPERGCYVVSPPPALLEALHVELSATAEEAS
jgi:exodeoxyribonuclease V beta subunit